ncbi:unnamed protein product [Ilex paraguariensis]|uniref:Uncharacterized protein n=1 Tax=Ilex paraguariensis TaxID=185542 RepID=A0ABC8UJK0_9AQUA
MDKNSLLNPKIFYTEAPILLLDDTPVTKKKLHKCSKEAVAGELEGFVKGLVTYMVVDGLVVQLMSTISCINVLNKFNVKEVGALVDLGMDKASIFARILIMNMMVRFILSNYVVVFRTLLPYEQVLRHQLCSLFMTSLRTNAEVISFEGETAEPYFRRLVLRSVAHIIRLYSSSLVMESEICIMRGFASNSKPHAFQGRLFRLGDCMDK